MLKWIAQHGPTLVSICAVGVMIWKASTGIDGELQVVKTQVSERTAAVEQKIEAQQELLDEKLEPIKEESKEMKRDIRLLQANVNGMSIAATSGAAERDRLLAGKIADLQETMYRVQESQEAQVDTLSHVQRELGVIKEGLRSLPDTLWIPAAIDSTKGDKSRSWLNPLRWLSGS